MSTALDIRRPMTASDRCDKCPAQAMVRATLLSGELHFCGHHGREVSDALVPKAIEVYDPEGVFNYGK